MADFHLEGFEDLQLIGRGGFGSVFRARQTGLGRNVAIKLIDASASDEEARKLFEREVRAMGALSSHPNIVTIFQSGIDAENRPYMIMEYLPSGSLDARLNRSGPLSPLEVAETGAKLARALAAAHQVGILHRDIKPENILVSDFGEPKLGDFGISRIQGQNSVSLVVRLTPTHAAPEAFSGEVSPLSDVWSLGSTLYTLAVGQAPFERGGEHDTMAALMLRIMTEATPDARAYGVPDALAQVLERALAKDPLDRIPSAADFALELEEARRVIAAGAPTTPMGVPEASAADDPNPTPPTGIVPVFAPDGTLAAPPTTPAPELGFPATADQPRVLASTVGQPVLPPTEPRTPTGDAPVYASAVADEEDEPRRRRGVLFAVLGAVLLIAAAVGGFALLSNEGDGSSTASEATTTTSSTVPETTTTIPVATTPVTVASTPRPTTKRTTPPTLDPTQPIITILSPPTQVDCSRLTNGTIILRWKTQFADEVEVDIDGPGEFDTFPASDGQAELPFSCGRSQHTYQFVARQHASGKVQTKTIIIKNTAPTTTFAFSG